MENREVHGREILHHILNIKTLPPFKGSLEPNVVGNPVDILGCFDISIGF